MTANVDFTKRLFQDSGITAGMRVLDVGCGGGDVSFLVSELVGGLGHVTGIDANERSIAFANAQRTELGLANVNFRLLDLADITSELGVFDAVVGRRILMYLQDPGAVVGALYQVLKPGGMMVFQEIDSATVSRPGKPMPLHDKVVKWIWNTLDSEGADVHMGFNLPKIMTDVGISVNHVRVEPVIQGYGAHHPLHFIVRAMQSRIVNRGFATLEEIDIETLEERLSAERAHGDVYISDMAFGVWGHKPL